MISPESKRVFFSFSNHIYRNSSQGVERNQVNDLKISCQNAGLFWGISLCKCQSCFHVYCTLVSPTSKIVSLKVKWYFSPLIVSSINLGVVWKNQDASCSYTIDNTAQIMPMMSPMQLHSFHILPLVTLMKHLFTCAK